MIISRRTKTAFIHIPKNGGTTVRRQMQQLHDIDASFNKAAHLPGVGRVHLAHLPSSTIREHFPEVYQILLDCQIFVLCRDPFSRFRSSVSQHLKLYKNISMASLGEAELRSRILDLIGEIDTSSDVLPIKLNHFVRQTEMLDDNMEISLFALEDMAGMMEQISVRTGVLMRHDHKDNETISLRDERLRKPLSRIAVGLKKNLPSTTYQALQKLAKRVLQKPIPQTTEGVFHSPEILDFVKTHYADDFALHRNAMDGLLAARHRS